MNIAGVTFKNPVMPASGTFGSGQEYSEFIDLNQLGAVVTKGVSYYPWEGNPPPRIMETSSGMINAVGLQNPGIDIFLKRDIPFLQRFDTKVIVNVCGNKVKDYLKVVERLSEQAWNCQEKCSRINSLNSFSTYAARSSSCSVRYTTGGYPPGLAV